MCVSVGGVGREKEREREDPWIIYKILYLITKKTSNILEKYICYIVQL